MKIKAYIDTNIFIYAIVKHPLLGETCTRILRDMKNKVYEAYGSHLVAIELMGALSKINPSSAKRALKLYLALDLTIVPLTEEVLTLAATINEVVNIKYDAVHAAITMLNNIPVVITNDRDDWLKLAENFDKVLSKVSEEGYRVSLKDIKIVTPNLYLMWLSKTL
ncbi:MAG: hypothetical protein DRN04_01860 [Thermoprotei archaeon]|nr:MAG: hypothetical protein DRN04_01860 [Thermoprotei archaeon]